MAILIDDHPMLRKGMISALDEDDRFRCVGEAGTISELKELLKSTRPEIALVDISLPDGNGFEIFPLLNNLDHRGKPWTTKVVFISMFIKPAYVARAISLGAWGYISKETPTSTAREGIKQVLQGQYFFDTAATDALVRWVKSVPHPEDIVGDERYNQLSSREKEVLSLLAKGTAPKEISQILYISEKTVINYRKTIFNALGVNNTAELHAYAEKLGIL